MRLRAASQAAFREIKLEEYRAEADAGFSDSAAYSYVQARLLAVMAARAAVSVRADEPFFALDAYRRPEAPETDVRELDASD